MCTIYKLVLLYVKNTDATKNTDMEYFIYSLVAVDTTVIYCDAVNCTGILNVHYVYVLVRDSTDM